MTRTIGALGGPHTFGGQAARMIVDSDSGFDDVVFLPSSPILFADDGQWMADAACVPAHTSRAGPHLSTHRRLCERSNLYVVAEATHTYDCALLVRAGSQLADIRDVQGHTGSLNQSRAWLTEHLPSATLTVVDSHSLGAAMAVADSDGSIAAIGTEQLAAELGLEIAARCIDGGSVGLYWALAPALGDAANPDRVVIAGHSGAQADTDRAFAALSDSGFSIAAIFSEAVGDQLLHNKVVVYGAGQGDLPSLQSRLDGNRSFRLAGAYVAPAATRPLPLTDDTRGAGVVA